MADIYLGLATIGTLAALMFLLSFSLSRRIPSVACDFAAMAVVGGIFAYIHFLWYSTRLTAIMPYSNLVVVGNWFPLAAGALGGLAWRRIPGRVFRKAIFVGGLTGVSAYSAVYPVLGDKPRCANVWSRNVCLQTTSRTCTPACAATLLRSHGIAATELEMADLCLTRAGTTWMGLYRGLKLKTAGTPWDVEVLSCDASQILRMRGSPLILSVGLPPEKSTDNQVAMTAEWGWKRGIGHSVILVRHSTNGRVVIADPTPAIGHEEWTRGDVKHLYRGTAMRLIKRS